jgi:hypothetical protein
MYPIRKLKRCPKKSIECNRELDNNEILPVCAAAALDGVIHFFQNP